MAQTVRVEKGCVMAGKEYSAGCDQATGSWMTNEDLLNLLAMLLCKRCGHQDSFSDPRWEITYRCSVCGELRNQWEQDDVEDIQERTGRGE